MSQGKGAFFYMLNKHCDMFVVKQGRILRFNVAFWVIINECSSSQLLAIADCRAATILFLEGTALILMNYVPDFPSNARVASSKCTMHANTQHRKPVSIQPQEPPIM